MTSPSRLLSADREREALAKLLAQPEHFGLLADDGEPYEPEWWQEKADALLVAISSPETTPAPDTGLRAAAQRREDAEEARADYEAALHDAWSETGEQPSDEQEEHRGRLGNELAEATLALRAALAALSSPETTPAPDDERDDWTKDGSHTNSSPAFLALVEEVARLIRGSAHSLMAGDSEGVARLVMAQLAHVHGLRPSPETTPAGVLPTTTDLEVTAGLLDVMAELGVESIGPTRRNLARRMAARLRAATPAGVLDEAALDEVAAWLLRVGYGIDYTFRDDDNKPDLAPLPVLEAMVRLGGADPGIAGDDGEEGAYYVLSSELGDWRAAALGRSGSGGGRG